MRACCKVLRVLCELGGRRPHDLGDTTRGKMLGLSDATDISPLESQNPVVNR